LKKLRQRITILLDIPLQIFLLRNNCADDRGESEQSEGKKCKFDRGKKCPGRIFFSGVWGDDGDRCLFLGTIQPMVLASQY
jgi:hypothetical protein